MLSLEFRNSGIPIGDYLRHLIESRGMTVHTRGTSNGAEPNETGNGGEDLATVSALY